MSVNLARIDVLARRLGISFREAARLVGRKGNRVRRERDFARRRPRVEQREPRYWWREVECE